MSQTSSPGMDKIVELLKALPGMNSNDVAFFREQLDAATDDVKLPPSVHCESSSIEMIPLEWYRVDGAPPDRALIYLHGGAYTMGSIKSHRPLVAEIAAESGFDCVSVGYRLAPEHPYPSALFDATTVYCYLLSLGYRPENIGIAGDSAGGGLALACLIALREKQYPQPAFAMLLSPWLDLTMSGNSVTTNAANDPLIQKDGLLPMAHVYLCGEDAMNPLCSPLFGDLDDLAPLLIQVGSHESLLDDSVRLEQRAAAFNIDVTLERWEHMVHVWHAYFAVLPEARQAIHRLGQFMREYWVAR